MKRIALALGCLASGCSFVFSHPPRRPHVSPSGHITSCRPSYVAPVIDTVYAISGAAFALAVSQDKFGLPMTDQKFTLAMTAGQGLVYAASAAYGYRQAQACEEQNAWLRSPEFARVRVAPVAPMTTAPDAPGAAPGTTAPQ
jgi:hypothetical protein